MGVSHYRNFTRATSEMTVAVSLKGDSVDPGVDDVGMFSFPTQMSLFSHRSAPACFLHVRAACISRLHVLTV
jgi:hypothetical protein